MRSDISNRDLKKELRPDSTAILLNCKSFQGDDDVVLKHLLWVLSSAHVLDLEIGGPVAAFQNTFKFTADDTCQGFRQFLIFAMQDFVRS